MVLELETFGGRWGGAGPGRVRGQVRMFTCHLLCVPSPALSCNENDAEHLDRDQPYPSSQKTKRMRTSFKHHQLRTMKSYFAINHNPDAKDLKQLAQKTGLTKRVLQVSWAVAGAEGGDTWRGSQRPVARGLRRTFHHLLCGLPFVFLCSSSISSVSSCFSGLWVLSPSLYLFFHFCLNFSSLCMRVPLSSLSPHLASGFF